MAGLTLDTGALLAVERNDPAVYRWLDSVTRRGDVVTVPTVALVQAWRGGARQARLAQLLRVSAVESLDESLARKAGELLARSATADPVDAVVAQSAAERGDVVLTSDPRDLRALGHILSSIRVHAI